MTIKDFVNKKIAIAFTSPEQIKEFAKMCEGHELEMWRQDVDACEWMLMEPKLLFNGFTIHNNVVHFIYIKEKKMGRGLSWCGDSTGEIEMLVRAGWKIVPFDEFKRDEKNGIYTIIISCDGNDVTTAKMIINGKIVKETRAKRNPEDKFDFKIASNVAFDRLFERVKEEKDEDFYGCEDCIHGDEDEDFCININCRHAFRIPMNANKPDRFKKRH